jgi:tryptophan-associated transmembrane protein
MRSSDRSSTLRLAGFVLTVGGGALVVLGSLLDWISVGLRGDAAGGFTVNTPGIDLNAGLAALALGALAILAIVALRLTHSTMLRRLVAIGVIAVGLGAAAIGIYEMSGARDRFLFSGVRPLAEHFNEVQGLPQNDQLADQVREQLRQDGFVDLKIGIYVVIAGGVLTAIGGALDFAWAGARRRERAEEG